MECCKRRLTLFSLYISPEKEALQNDCKDKQGLGVKSSGDYLLYLGGSLVKVYCDMSTEGGGWTVFQRRKDGSVDFYRNWKNYENGFGDVNGEFWLGNKWIHLLTLLGTTELRIDFGGGVYAKYSNFSIGDAASKYTLTVSGYSGTASDQLAYHNNMKFSTFDQDNDAWVSSCAKGFKGAWWYKSCLYSNLNSIWGESSGVGIYWSGYRTFTEMKLRRT